MTAPLFRWPGGKRWLVRELAPHVDISQFRTYLEPFLGAGAMLFALEPPRAIATDVNSDLIECYRAIKSDPKRVYASLSKFRTSEKDYYRIRDHFSTLSIYTKAARFIYLLRHSWNGLYRVNAKGEFNVPYSYRTYRNGLSREHLLSIQKVLMRTNLSWSDFQSAIDRAGAGDLVFADPPYFASADQGFSRYNSSPFCEPDQMRLVTALRSAERRGAAWILTLGPSVQTESIFPGASFYRFPRKSLLAADSSARKRIYESVIISRCRELQPLRDHLDMLLPKKRSTSRNPNN